MVKVVIMNCAVLDNLNLCWSIFLRKHFNRWYPFKFRLRLLLPNGCRRLLLDGVAL